MKTIVKSLASMLLLLSTQLAFAVPTSLEGLGLVSQWRDAENTLNDIPNDPWGISDNVFADSVGIYVEFANGIVGSATYVGLDASDWNQCCAFIATPDTMTGAFTNADLHGLNHSSLPMAWGQLSIISPFSNNFDLDYNNQNGSNFRASATGWDYVDIGLYSSAAAVPAPASLFLIGLGLLGLGARKRLG